MLGCLECTTQQACTGVYVHVQSRPLSATFDCIIGRTNHIYFKQWILGRAWADSIAQLHSFCIRYKPVVPVMSPHCTAQYPTTNTQALCSKFSVMPMSKWTSQSSSTVSPSVVYKSAVASCQATTAPLTVSLCSICLYHVSAHLPTCTCLHAVSDNLHSRQRMAPCFMRPGSC